jgi:hypothetical protein
MADPTRDGSRLSRLPLAFPLLFFRATSVLLCALMVCMVILQPPAVPLRNGESPSRTQLRGGPGQGGTRRLTAKSSSDVLSHGAGTQPERPPPPAAAVAAAEAGATPLVVKRPTVNAGRGNKSVHGMQSNKDIEQQPEWQHLVAETCSIDYRATVEAQLARWPIDSKSIEEDQLHELYCMRKQLARVSLVNGTVRVSAWQLTMDQNRVLQTLWLFKLASLRAASRGNPLPALELVLNPTDKTSDFGRGRFRGKAGVAPLFCNARCVNDTSVSLPMMFHAQFGGARGEMSLPMYNTKYQGLLEMDTGHDTWSNKSNNVFFSASNTRGHRARLLAALVPGLVAVNGTVPLQEYTRHRFVVYAYGHNGWSQRLRELALFRSVVLLESSSCTEYYQDVFVANEDYIPVLEDFSDLPKQILALRAASTARLEAMAGRWAAKGREASARATGPLRACHTLTGCSPPHVGALLSGHAPGLCAGLRRGCATPLRAGTGIHPAGEAWLAGVYLGGRFQRPGLGVPPTRTRQL